MESRYIQARVPDKAGLSKLILKAKGNGRTMAEFAESCGVSAATFSRIATGKIVNPLSEMLLEKICEKSADGFIDMRLLARANGMIDRETYENRKSSGRHFVQRTMYMDRARDMERIITSELFIRGVQIRKLGNRVKKRHNIYVKNELTRTIYHDLTIEFVDGSGSRIWGFEMAPLVRDKDDTKDDDRRVVQKFIQKEALFFLQDAWEPECHEEEKLSFVFCEEVYYRIFNDMIPAHKLNNPMSSILIDIHSGKVLKERILSCNDSKQTESVFDRPVEVDEEDDVNEQFIFFLEDNE